MDNIIKAVIYLKNIGDHQLMRDTELEYNKKHAPYLVDESPASTVVQIVSLAKPNMLIGIDVIVAKP